MALDLSSYRSIQTNLFVKLDIPGYEVLTFSDYHKAYTLSGTNYQGLGQLLSISDTSSSLRATGQELTLTISGIPDGNIADVLTTKIKGSSLTILRAFFNSTTGELLNIPSNPVGKFNGVISNYTIADDLGEGDRDGTLTITFVATNVVDLLNNKVTGRRTNPLDQKEFYPTDESFDRVPSLAKSNFNFGAPTQ
jgi:hypothetical protein